MNSKSNLGEGKSGEETSSTRDPQSRTAKQTNNSPDIPEKNVSEDASGKLVEVEFSNEDELTADSKSQDNSDPLANLYSLITELNLIESSQPTKFASLSEQSVQITAPESTLNQDLSSLEQSEKPSESVAARLAPEEFKIEDRSEGRLAEQTIIDKQAKTSQSADSSQVHAPINSEITDSKSIDPEHTEPSVIKPDIAESNSTENAKLEYADELYDRSYINKLIKQDPLSDSSPSLSLLNLDTPDPELATSVPISPDWIIQKERQINDLASSINSLLPLVVELSQARSESSQAYIFQTLVPIIDQVIQQRVTEDQAKMAEAIAKILPTAIQQEISQEPKSIGQAIAPELALSITEQIRLDENAIAEALGSEMGKAIKNQIEQEREAMVDALYPVIGSTISKYMAEVIESINYKVDNALSPKGIQRKIQAKIQGVSEAELILQESLPCQIQAAFLIQNNSGLVIAEFQPQQESQLEADLLAGMLTAIRSFGDDCISSNSELDEIDYGNFKIMFETAGYCYLAVVVNGEADSRFSKHINEVFGKIIQKYGDEIKHYQGEQNTSITAYLRKHLEELQPYKSNSEQTPQKSPKTLFWLIGILLLCIFIPWGIIHHRNSWRKSIEHNLAIELDASPELSVYRLIPKIKEQKLLLQGRVPSPYLVNLATKVATPIANQAELELDNQIIAVNIPPDPTFTKQEVERTASLINQQILAHKGTSLNRNTFFNASYSDQTVTINSQSLTQSKQKQVISAFKAIPGVENVIFLINQELPAIKTRIYFPPNLASVSSSELLKLDEVATFLRNYPYLGLTMISHSDNLGSKESNFKLGEARTQYIYQNLINRGLNPERLKVVVKIQPPPDIIEGQSSRLNRCIRFEPFGIRSN